MTLLLTFGLIMLPQWGKAEMVPVSDEQLRDISGQGSPSFAKEENKDQDKSIQKLFQGDKKDGLGLALNNGTNFESQLTSNLVNGLSGFGLLGFLGIPTMNLTTTNMTVSVDHLYVDAIRVGPSAGSRNTLGSFYMSNLVAGISGAVQVGNYH